MSRKKKSKAIKRWHSRAMLIDPRKTKIYMVWTSDLTEASDVIVPEPQIAEIAPTETLTTNNFAENLEIAEPDLTEASDVIVPEPQIADTTPETSNIPLCIEETRLIKSMREKPAKEKFLKTLQKTRRHWRNDKNFAKAQKRMEKGKKLKNNEFFELYFLLRERGEKAASRYRV
jgi:hypothetical protein